MTSGDQIRYYRKKQNISQETLAEKLNITRQAVAKWESGKSNPSTENLIRAAEVLGVSLEELTGREKNPLQSGDEENSSPAESNIPSGKKPSCSIKHAFVKFLAAFVFIFTALILFLLIAGKSDSQLIFDAIITLINLGFLGGFFYIIIMIIKALKKNLSE